MLRMMLGRMAAGLLTETRSDTNIVIVGGYNSGAGSKFEGTFKGSHREGWRCRYPHATTRSG